MAARNVERERITFSFGENWGRYREQVTDDAIREAQADIVDWLGEDGCRGKRVVDVGSGSGIHSLCFHRAGAAEVLSFDVDPSSVQATARFWVEAGMPASWQVTAGSILAPGFVERLGTFDVVYSWGVLHHTGAMWDAIDRACALVAAGGRMWITLYAAGPRYAQDLALKRRYNAGRPATKKAMELAWIGRFALQRARRLENPLGWNERRARGMNAYHDLVDWLGGLPYEVASVEDVVRFCEARGLESTRVAEAQEGACSGYLFTRPK